MMEDNTRVELRAIPPPTHRIRWSSPLPFLLPLCATFSLRHLPCIADDLLGGGMDDMIQGDAPVVVSWPAFPLSCSATVSLKPH